MATIDYVFIFQEGVAKSGTNGNLVSGDNGRKLQSVQINLLDASGFTLKYELFMSDGSASGIVEQGTLAGKIDDLTRFISRLRIWVEHTNFFGGLFISLPMLSYSFKPAGDPNLQTLSSGQFIEVPSGIEALQITLT